MLRLSPDMTMSFNAKTDQVIVDETATVKETWGSVIAGGVTTLSIDNSTGLITSIKYVSPDGSDYTVTLNATETPTIVKVNQKTNGSYQMNYDTNNTQLWRSFVQVYAGKNETGVLTEKLFRLMVLCSGREFLICRRHW